jgi:uncharacterized protein
MVMKAYFRDGALPHGGQRLVVMHEPAGTPRGIVVGAAAFAEEMNKGRRTAAMGARALAREGFLVLQVDLAGCGDSSGDLASATWAAWVDDVLDTVRHARSLAGDALPLTLWGIRAGCLVVSQAGAKLAESGHAAHLLLWQPQPNGKLVLQQFLRLKLAGQLQLAAAQGAAEAQVTTEAPTRSAAPPAAPAQKGITEKLGAELAAGRPIEIAGYVLGPGVANGLAAAQLRPPAADAGVWVLWLEVSAQMPPELLPVSHNTIERWRASGVAVQAAAVSGPLFWQTQDIEEAPELVERGARDLRALHEAALAV